MDVLLLNQELEVDVEKDCSIGHENMLHVVVLI